jgi:serine/threonine-protein kinase
LAHALVRASANGNVLEVQPGDLIDGRYEVLRMIGTGGMGSVFEVKRLSDGSSFAMKMLSRTCEPIAVARLAREAQSALKVDSPHVVSIRDVGMSRGQLFLVMDLVAGPTLAMDRQRQGDRPWGVGVLRQIAQGIEDIHRAGVVHRDIKPSNIIMSYGDDAALPRVKIADFGIASVKPSSTESTEREVGGQSSLTRTGHILGTPAYMAPEVHDGGRDVGPPSDMFSFGILAREVLYGKKGSSVPLGLLVAVSATHTIVPFDRSHSDIDEETAEVIDQCLAFNPLDRPSAARVRMVLARYEERLRNGSVLVFRKTGGT